MRLICTLAALLATACGQTRAPPATTPEVPVEAAHSASIICDATNAPLTLIFERAPTAGHSRLIQIDKNTGAAIFDGQLTYGQAEGAAGSVYSPFSIDGQDAGMIRNINPGMLENPAAAYTSPVTSVKFRDIEASCRWLPRTRLVGVTERRSLVVHEDADGDLIYTTFDFSDAAAQTAVDLSENGRSTTFSVEARDGQEAVTPEHTAFTFAAPHGYEYRVLVEPEDARIEVWRDGALALNEPFVAYQLGQAE